MNDHAGQQQSNSEQQPDGPGATGRVAEAL